jgi:GNAT superfamily N-acetyltransferase
MNNIECPGSQPCARLLLISVSQTDHHDDRDHTNVGVLRLTMALSFTLAGPKDAQAIAALRSAAARALAARYGDGPWAAEPSERSVLGDFRHADVWAAWEDEDLVATFRLATRKPWAIDAAYFTGARRPLYLTNMAVHPDMQRRGVGRLCLIHAEEIARGRSADAIRLDAYDAEAGAGPFYARCGFQEAGRVVYRTTPLVYYERLLRQA